MPTYEYACKQCGNTFERFESITAAPNKTCPKCNKKKAERLISGGGGFIFKGTGFYVTDYKKKSGTAPVENAPKKEGAPASADTAAPAASAGSCGSGCGCHPAPAPAAKTGSKKSDAKSA